MEKNEEQKDAELIHLLQQQCHVIYYKCSLSKDSKKKHYSNCFLMQCKQSNPLCIHLLSFQPHLECMYSLVTYRNPLFLAFGDIFVVEIISLV